MTYQPKWVYLGVAENFNPGQASQSKTIGKSNKGEKHYFTEKKEVRMGCCEQTSGREKEEFSMIMGFQWLSCRGSLSLQCTSFPLGDCN